MTTPSLRTIAKTVLDKLFVGSLTKAWAKGQRGVAALEFALVAPMLITMYLGLAELSLGLDTDRKVSHAASVAADMATQTTELDAEAAAEIFVAALAVSEIQDPDNFALHLESYTRDEDGNAVSLGAVWFNEGNLSELDDVDVDAISESLLSESSGLMIARIAYDYKPLGYSRVEHGNAGGPSAKKGDSFFNQTVKLSEVIFFTPRESQTVTFDSGDNDGFECALDGGSMSCSAADDPSGGNGGANDECVNGNGVENGNANCNDGNNGNGNGNGNDDDDDDDDDDD